MPAYPLIFTLAHDIRCPNFSARVVTKGRTLMVFEEDEWWCHGVEPGGLTEHGADPGLAFAGFKAAFRGILQDLAAESVGFREFENAVRAFVSDADKAASKRWQEAREEFRAGKPVDAPFDALKRITDEVHSTVKFEDVALMGQPEVVELAEAA